MILAIVGLRSVHLGDFPGLIFEMQHPDISLKNYSNVCVFCDRHYRSIMLNRLFCRDNPHHRGHILFELFYRKIVEDILQTQLDEQYKFEKDACLGWVLNDFSKGEWRKFIAFTEENQLEVDFIQPSFYCEKHPESIFNKTVMTAIKTPTGRKTINDREYKEFTGTNVSYIEENISDERLKELLEKEFFIKNI